MIEHLRPGIRAMAGYTPGEQPRDGDFIKLNTNENPYPPSPRVFEAIRDALTGDRLRKYPDPLGDALPPDGRPRARRRSRRHPDRQRLRRHPDDPHARLRPRGRPDRLADAELPPLPHAGRDPGRPLRRRCRSPPTGSCPNRGRSRRPHLTFLANPNSPSGTTRLPPPARAACRRSSNGPLVVDEAYVDFADDNALRPGAVDAERDRHADASASRTALAGIRFGFAVADPAVVRELVKVKDSYNCDVLSLAAATAALEDQDYFRAIAGEDPRHARPDGSGAAPSRLRRDAEPGELRLVPPRRPAGEADLRGAETAR